MKSFCPEAGPAAGTGAPGVGPISGTTSERAAAGGQEGSRN